MQRSEINNQRIAWIDTAKGIAILLVIVMQTIGVYTSTMNIGSDTYTFWHKLYTLISVLIIPLFFFISGWLFNSDKYKNKPLDFIKSRTITLIIPYIVFSVIGLLLYSAIAGKNLFVFDTPIKVIMDILTIQGIGNITGWLWFLPALFLVELIYYILSRFLYPEKEGWLKVAMIIAGLFGVVTKMYLPFMAALIFYGMGHLYRKSEEKEYEDEEHVEKIWIPATGFALFLVVQNYLPSSVWMPSNIPVYALSTIIILVGVISVTRIIRWMYLKNKYFDVLEDIGKNSIIFYIMHGFFLVIFKTYFPVLGTPIDVAIISSIVILLCIPFIKFFRDHAPFIVGVKNYDKM